MKEKTEFTQNDLDVIQRAYASLKESARKRCANQEQLDLVQKAFDFANSAHNGIRRRSGEPYMLHPIAVASIVVNEIGLGCKSICAALLHDVVEDTSYTVEDIQSGFGEKIASLVDGLTKIKTVLDNEDNNGDDQSLQAENFRRILLTLNDDIRVVLIKLADRMHNCRTIEFMPEYKREKILSETMYIFIPLAHRLGLYQIKSEMENIWLRFKEPDAYDTITRKVAEFSTNHDKMIDEFFKPIAVALNHAGIEYEFIKRVKTPYSIWHKIKTKHVSFEDISDIFAVRIVFKPNSEGLMDERNECFRIFSIITSIYDYRPERVRDWVMHPKPNGYEALHLTVIAKDRTNIEIQIRTTRMDDIAEKGIAAHWNYKKMQGDYCPNEDSRMDQWIQKVKEILNNPDANSLEKLDRIHDDLVDSFILVFDNKGQQHEAAKMSTALDYAYNLDKETGNHAIAAKINYKLCPLSYTLKSGDQVEIITSGKEMPKREWLEFLTTKTAIDAVKQYFGIEDSGAIKANDKYKIATCCNPIPGDPVVGFIQADGSIEIHHKTCPNADSLASKFGDRIITPKWIVDTYANFPVRLSINGIDRMGLIHEISSKISQETKISFKSINFTTHDGLFGGYLDIWVHDTETLDAVIKLLSSIRGIENISRVEIK